MKNGINRIQKNLLFVIGVLSVILAAVLVSKGYGFYREKQQEKEWAERNQEVQEEIVSVRMKIEQLARDEEALQAFLDEQARNVIVLEERQAAGQDVAGQESVEGVREASSGAIVIGMEETPREEWTEGQAGEESVQAVEPEPSVEEINRQGLDAAAGGAIIIDAPPAPEPPVRNTEKADGTVSGNSSEEEGEEDTVSGNGIKETEEEETVSGNGIKETEEEETVSGNGIKEAEEEETVSGNGIKEAEEEDTVSGNGIIETEEEDTISGNAVVDGRVIPFVNGESEPTLEQRRSIRSSYLETVQTNGEDKEYISNSGYDFSGVRIACLGDSITEGSNLDQMENYQQYSYPSVLKNILQAEEVYNLGIGGSSYGRYWDNAFVDRYREIPKDTDIILVMGGTNDGFAASDQELGSLAEKKRRTFYGDVDELMQGLKREYPDAKIIFATPLPNVLHDYLRAQRNYLLPQGIYAKAIKELAAQYQIDVIDLYNSNLLDTHDAQVITHYMPDGVHGNPAGYQVLAEHMARNIIEIVQRDGLEDGNAQPDGTVSGNGTSGGDGMETVSGNGTSGGDDMETVSGNGTVGGNMPKRMLTPEEAKRLEEERIAREREEAARAAENNKKVAEGALIITPETEAVPEVTTQAPHWIQEETTPDAGEPERKYEYDGEAIVIQ